MSTHAAYRATRPGPLLVDRATYSSFADESARRSTARFRIPIQSGKAWGVAAGHVARLSTPEGPQVADVNLGICRPIDVEVSELEADLLQNWQPPVPSAYAGRHGLVHDRA